MKKSMFLLGLLYVYAGYASDSSCQLAMMPRLDLREVGSGIDSPVDDLLETTLHSTGSELPRMLSQVFTSDVCQFAEEMSTQSRKSLEVSIQDLSGSLARRDEAFDSLEVTMGTHQEMLQQFIREYSEMSELLKQCDKQLTYLEQEVQRAKSHATKVVVDCEERERADWEKERDKYVERLKEQRNAQVISTSHGEETTKQHFLGLHDDNIKFQREISVQRISLRNWKIVTAVTTVCGFGTAAWTWLHRKSK